MSVWELRAGAKRSICRLSNPDQALYFLAGEMLHADARAHDSGGHLGAHAFSIVPPPMVSAGGLTINHLTLHQS